MHMDKTVYKEDIKEELQRIRDELDSLEEKIRKGLVHEALRQLSFIIDDIDKLIDDVNRYNPLDDVDDDEIAEVCIENWGCKCPEG
jgi:methionyl-tRNA synthetase